jgi:hypothetical protein
MAEALKPTPNHTSAGPLRVMVALAEARSSATPTVTSEAVCPAAPWALAPAPQAAAEAAGARLKTTTMPPSPPRAERAEQPGGVATASVTTVCVKFAPALAAAANEVAAAAQHSLAVAMAASAVQAAVAPSLITEYPPVMVLDTRVVSGHSSSPE